MKKDNEENNRFDFVNRDIRVFEKNLQRHLVSLAEYQKYLKSLPDDQDRSEEMTPLSEGENS